MDRKLSWFVLAIFLVAFAGCNPSSPGPSDSTPKPTATSKATVKPKPTETPLPTLLPRPTFETPAPLHTVVPTVDPSRPTPKPSPTPTLLRTPTPEYTLVGSPSLKKGEKVNISSGSARFLTFEYLSAFVSDRAIVQSGDSFRTYFAKKGQFKFVILTYRFKNDYNLEQTTPGMTSAEILTEPKGHVYKLWAVPSGDAAATYSPVTSWPPEVTDLGGSDAGGVKLQPDYGVQGRIVFEIPEEMTPVEATVASMKLRLLITDPTAYPATTPIPVPQTATPLP